jgi:hypothetical protein
MMVQLVASRCTELESGGRMIDAILSVEQGEFSFNFQ